MGFNAQDLFVAALLSLLLFVVLFKWIQGIREINNHKAAHHHIEMMNAEVARRYQERVLNSAEL